jgi:hypothetical protein
MSSDDHKLIRSGFTVAMSGKPDTGKLAHPVWGWGRGAMPGLHHTTSGMVPYRKPAISKPKKRRCGVALFPFPARESIPWKFANMTERTGWILGPSRLNSGSNRGASGLCCRASESSWVPLGDHGSFIEPRGRITLAAAVIIRQARLAGMPGRRITEAQ